MNEILSRIAPPSRASFTALEDVPAWCDGNPIEWSSIGPSCDLERAWRTTGRRRRCAGTTPTKAPARLVAAAAKPPVVNLRAMRKRWQVVESFAGGASGARGGHERCRARRRRPLPPMRVVDFGAAWATSYREAGQCFPGCASRQSSINVTQRCARAVAPPCCSTNVDVDR